MLAQFNHDSLVYFSLVISKDLRMRLWHFLT
jgi:hypothetical protein